MNSKRCHNLTAASSGVLNPTANKTARIILQERKFGLGSIIITQRTANVVKTMLNQCNTIIALQSFDQTGLDFLKNYMGDEYSNSISTLPLRHAILVGKASSSSRPVIFKIENLEDASVADRLEIFGRVVSWIHPNLEE